VNLGKKLLAPLLVALVAATGFLAGYQIGQPDYVIGEYDGNAMRVEVYLYKNGELVYYDPDDPATTNFLALLEAVLEGTNDAEDNVIRMDGTTYDLEYHITTTFRDSGSTWVLVSNESSTFSRTMYTFTSAQASRLVCQSKIMH